MKRRRVEVEKTDRPGAALASTNSHPVNDLSKEGIIMTSRNFSRKRIGQALRLLALGLVLLVAGYSATATEGQHRDSEIPGSGFLFVFSPIAYGVYPDDREVEAVQSEIRELVKRVDDHGYRPVYYLSDRPSSQPPPGYDGYYIKATAENFKDILQEARGILFVSSHGGNDLLMIEHTGIMDACRTKVRDYVQTRGIFADGELRCVLFRFGKASSVGIAITGAAIRKYFQDTETIVHISACQSWSLADDFSAARDFFGYDDTCPSDKAEENTKVLWGRLHGVEDRGASRPATVAGQGLPNGLKHQHRPGALDTVLSPAVQQHLPVRDDVFVVPTEVQGSVRFDARMDTSVDPDDAIPITVMGCDAHILNVHWASDFELRFTLQLNTPGQAKLWVFPERAQAVGRFWKNPLDGNTEWRDGKGPDRLGNLRSSNDGGEDHIGPNDDPFVWKVWCVKEGGTSFSFTVPVGPGGSCHAKTPALGPININEIWATVLNSETNQPLPQGTPVTFTVNLKPGVEKLEHISQIDSITVSAPGFKPKEVKGPFSAMGISIPGPVPVTIQIINLGTVPLDPA